MSDQRNETPLPTNPAAEERTARLLPRYEPRDVSAASIGVILVASAICGGLALYAAGTLFRHEVQRWNLSNESSFPLSADTHEPQRELPPTPRLEQVDRLSGREESSFNRQEQLRFERLASYGAADEAGYAHIPIERAIELVVDELPVRTEPPKLGRDRGLVDAGEPNSGRLLRGARK